MVELREVVEVPTLWVRLREGRRLAARMWLPADANTHPVPAILESIPYRRRDGTIGGDALSHPWWAARGYAAIRLDIAGSGDSDGLLLDEYLPQEQSDVCAAIGWIAEQRWCSGSVGMIGIRSNIRHSFPRNFSPLSRHFDARFLRPAGAGSRRCRWRPAARPRSRRSSPAAPPTTATPTMSTTWAAAC